jgi:hypothetical protein
LSLQEREDAIEYLRNKPTSTGIERLVAALEDMEFGIRWSAGTALAQLGDAAFVPILKALTRRVSACGCAKVRNMCSSIHAVRVSKKRRQSFD